MRCLQLFTNSPLRNFSYLVFDEKSDITICLDPFYPEQIVEQLFKLGRTLTHIINTHEHGDHTCGNPGLLEEFPHVNVLAHEKAKDKIPGFTKGLSQGDRIPLSGKSYLEVLDTPGHTFSHLCLLGVENGRPQAVFTGDTLFNAGVGNCRNGGDPETLYETISEQFFPMDEEIRIYPGHDYLENNLKFTLQQEPSNSDAAKLLKEWVPRHHQGDFSATTIAMERKINTFFHIDSPGQELLASVRKEDASLPDSPNPKEVFLTLRRLRDRW